VLEKTSKGVLPFPVRGPTPCSLLIAIPLGHHDAQVFFFPRDLGLNQQMFDGTAPPDSNRTAFLRSKRCTRNGKARFNSFFSPNWSLGFMTFARLLPVLTFFGSRKHFASVSLSQCPGSSHGPAGRCFLGRPSYHVDGFPLEAFWFLFGKAPLRRYTSSGLQFPFDCLLGKLAEWMKRPQSCFFPKCEARFTSRIAAAVFPLCP